MRSDEGMIDGHETASSSVFNQSLVHRIVAENIKLGEVLRTYL